MKKCTVIGKFAFEKHIMDGQTVKCSTIYNELVDRYDKKNISYIDTYNWKKHILKTFISCLKAMKQSENVIMLPAQNGVIIFGPLLAFLKKIHKRKIHYIVIGSWLLEKINKNKILCKSLKKFDAIYVETSLLKRNLESKGFNNVYKMNNYKKIQMLDSNQIKPFKLKKILKTCIFSRINYEKGVEDAINVISKINSDHIKIILNIYGPIEDSFKKRFDMLIHNNSKFVKYSGIIESSQSVEIVKNYDLLLFPTRYKTEGIPGTIIDAFAAGIPVLASSWDNYKDIIDDGKNGIVFRQYDVKDFNNKLIWILNNQKDIYNMKKHCLESASHFCNSEAISVLINNI